LKYFFTFIQIAVPLPGLHPNDYNDDYDDDYDYDELCYYGSSQQDEDNPQTFHRM